MRTLRRPHRNKQPFTFIIVSNQNINISIISLVLLFSSGKIKQCALVALAFRQRQETKSKRPREQFHLTVVFSLPPRLFFFPFRGQNLNKRKKMDFWWFLPRHKCPVSFFSFLYPGSLATFQIHHKRRDQITVIFDQY